MKRYLFIVPSLASGGAERAVSNFASELVRQGENATIIIYFRMKIEYRTDSRVKIVNLSGGDLHQYSQMGYVKKISRLRRILKEENPDYIIPFLFQVMVHTSFAGYDMHDKIINTIRNNPSQSPENRILRFLRNQIIIRSWKIIVQNKQQQDYFSKKIQKKIYILRNPIDESLFLVDRKTENQKYKIVVLGRLAPQKNIPLFLRAFTKVHSRYPYIEAEIYGDGPEKEKIRSLINEYGLNDVITFMGRTGNVGEVYSHANLYVLSSNYEGMPNTLMEAMAVGVPSISTNCRTGPADLITNKENGLLVSVDSDEELAEAIIYMYEHLSEAEKMGLQGKATIKSKCSSPIIVHELRRICEE